MADIIRRALKSVLTLKQIEENENANQWNLVHLTPALNPRAAKEMIWSMGDEKNLVHYVEEPTINEKYFLIEGSNRLENLEKIAAVVPLYDPEELFELADKSEGAALIPILPKLAVSAPLEKEDRYLQLFQNSLESSNADLRYEALVAMGFVAWKGFEVGMQKAEKDVEKDISKLATFLLTSLREKVWKA